MAKETVIKLENDKGKVVEYKAGKTMARTTRDIMSMYAKFEKVDEKGNQTITEVEMIDMMIDVVANSIFKRVPAVTVDAILDGVEADQLDVVLQDVIMSAMGIEETDVEEAEEGK